MIVALKVMPRREVLDTQGRAVAESLQRSGFALESCRVGKYIEVQVEESDPDKALEKLREMAEYVLYNPLIETFEMEVVQGSGQ